MDKLDEPKVWRQAGGCLLGLMLLAVLGALGVMVVRKGLRDQGARASMTCPVCGAKLEVDLKEKQP